MCGRITENLKLDALVEKFRVRLGLDREMDLTPHYNGAPGQDFVAVRSLGKERVLVELQWGDIPAWARNQPGAKRLINARSETVLEKPSFRSAFRQRRCVVPVNGWFEWRPEDGHKQPYWIRPEDADVFTLAQRDVDPGGGFFALDDALEVAYGRCGVAAALDLSDDERRGLSPGLVHHRAAAVDAAVAYATFVGCESRDGGHGPSFEVQEVTFEEHFRALHIPEWSAAGRPATAGCRRR